MALGTGIASIGSGVKVGSAYGLVSIRSNTTGISKIKKGLLSLNPMMAAAGLAGAALSASITGIGVAVAATSAAIFDGTRRFAEFDYIMDSVRAKAGGTPEALAAVTEEAERLGKTTVFTARQIADGMNFLAMTGFSTGEIISSMKEITNLAAVGMVDLGRASDITSNILRAYGLEAEDAGRITDVLTNAMIDSNVTLETIGQTMKFLGPTANLLGFSIEEMSAAVGVLGDSGIQASMAGTNLRQALLSLAAPTKQTAATMKKYGIEVDDGTGNMIGFVDLIEQLNEKLGHLGGIEQTAALKKLFGKRGLGAISILMDSYDTSDKTLRDFVERMGESGTAAEQARAQLDNLKGDVILLNSAFDGFMMDIGKRFEPLMRSSAQALTAFIAEHGDTVVDWFGLLADKIQEMLPLFKAWLPIIKDWVMWAGTNLADAFSWLLTKGTELYEMFNLELFTTDVGNFGWFGAIMGALDRFGVNTSVIKELWGWYEWARAMASTSWEWIENLVTWLEALYTVGIKMYDAWGGIEGIFELIKAYISSGALFDDSVNLADEFWGWILTAVEMAAEQLKQLTQAFKDWALQPDTQANAAEIGEMIGRWILEGLGYEFDDEGNITDISESFIDKLAKSFLNVFEGVVAIGATIAANIVEGVINGLTDGDFQAMTISELDALFARIQEDIDKHGKLNMVGAFTIEMHDWGQQLQADIASAIESAIQGVWNMLYGKDYEEGGRVFAFIFKRIVELGFDLVEFPFEMLWSWILGGDWDAQLDKFMSENDDIFQAFVNLGEWMVEGIGVGIGEGFGKVSERFRRLLVGMKFLAQEIMGIESPSSVMADEVGEPMGMGIAQGLENSMLAIKEAMNMSGLVRSAEGAGAGTTNTNNSRSLVIEGPLVSVSGGGDVEKITEAVSDVLDKIFQQSDSSGVYK